MKGLPCFCWPDAFLKGDKYPKRRARKEARDDIKRQMDENDE